MKLAKKRKEWVAQFKPTQLKGSPLHYNASSAMKYKDKLDKLIAKMSEEVEKELRKLYKSKIAKAYFAEDASIASQARIVMNALNKKFVDLFSSLSNGLAENMVNNEDQNSKSSLFQSMAQLSGGLRIKTDIMSADLEDVIKASIAENVSLIKSIPDQYFTAINGAVMRSVTSGQGLKDLLPFIEQHKEITKRRAKTIAYDQTRKAFSSINTARMEKVGIKKFMWHHSSAGAHPRKEHIALDGKVFSFDDLPIIDSRTGERGLPAQAPNCKCFMSPVIEFDND